MSYAGSFNGFQFGDRTRSGAPGAQAGASVSSLSGWRDRNASVQVTEGPTFNALGAPSYPPSQVSLGLALIGDNAAALDGLIDDVIRRFDPAAGEMPLTIDGWTRWVQVTRVSPIQQPDWPGPERTTPCTISFLGDPVLYTSTYAERTWPSGAPDTTDTFNAANAGWEVPFAHRAFELRLTAHGTTVRPRVRVDHPDGSFEQVTFDVTMSGGQVLTLGADGYPRIGSQIASKCISTNQTGLSTPSRLPWRLIDSTGSDGRNEVTVSVQSGAFSGYLRTRGTKV